MKYRLLKDKITTLYWMDVDKNDSTLLVNFGWALELDQKNPSVWVDVLPDIVEEFKPTGFLEFNDDSNFEDVVHTPREIDFFFRAEKMARRDFETKLWSVYDRVHYVRISRNWVEPVEDRVLRKSDVT
jgi:hypothetical protein